MSNLNRLNYSFPYFVSNKDQILYVMLPASNPTVFKHSHENTGKFEDFSTEEEILPDFKCEKCSVRILTYSELRAHQQDHEKSDEAKLSKSYFPGTDQVEGLGNTHYVLKLNNPENLKNGKMFHHLKYGSHLGTTTKSINIVSNKVFSSETASNPLHKGDKRYLSSNRIVASFNNCNSNLHNLKVSHCSKSEKPLQMQSTVLKTELKKPNLLKLPLIPKLNKGSIPVLTFNASNSKVSDLFPITGNFEVNSELTENISVTNMLHSPEISREGYLEGKNIYIAESSTTNSASTFTYADPKELLTSIKRKKNPIVKPYSDFSRQPQMTTLNTKVNTYLRDSNFSVNLRKNRCKTEVNHTMGKFNGSFLTFQTLFDKSSPIASIYSENEISKEDNTKNKTTSRSHDINTLQSKDVYDNCMPIVQRLADAEDKDELNTKESVVFTKSFAGGSLPETLSEKGIDETMDKFSDFTSTYQPIANMKLSDVSSYYKCEMYTEKNDRYRALKYDGRSSLKRRASQRVELNERDVYILEPLTNDKEKPFRCFYCRKTFESRFYMRRHLLEHEETKTNFCVLCNSFFTRIETLREHVLIFHCQAKDEKQCPYCDYRYFRKTNFENHIASKHAVKGFK